MVCFDDNPVPAQGIFHGEDGRHLHVVRQHGHQGIGLRAFVYFKGHFLYAIVLPLGDGSQMQFSQGAFLQDGRLKALRGACLPAFHIGPGVKGYAGFRQPVVGFGQILRRTVCRMHAAEPPAFRKLRTVKPQLRLPAAQMGESVLAEVPQKKGYPVLPLFQIRGQLNLVKITVLRIGASFEGAFKHHQLPVHPQPVFAVHGYPRQGRCRNLLQRHVPAEGNPLVGSLRGLGASQRLRRFQHFFPGQFPRDRLCTLFAGNANPQRCHQQHRQAERMFSKHSMVSYPAVSRPSFSRPYGCPRRNTGYKWRCRP